MKKIIFGLLIIMFITGCTSERLSEEVDGDTANVIDQVSGDQINDMGEEESESQPEEETDSLTEIVPMEDREIVCENPCFFPQDTSFMAAGIIYVRAGLIKTRTIAELQLNWLKQYDNGCLVKLSIVPFDGMPDYMDEERLNTYFYVTSNEIYRISPYIEQEGGLTACCHDDALLISVMNTDEKLIENGELLCWQEDQIFYNREEIEQNEAQGYYENFTWEEGTGLVGYISGYGDGDSRAREIVYLEDIIYGTAGQDEEDREIVCENPYFFPQEVSSLTATLSHDWSNHPFNGELELHWLKQYDNGCLARLTVVPFDDIPPYMDMKYLNHYFYVTPDEIYCIHFYAASKYFNSCTEHFNDPGGALYLYHRTYDASSSSFDHMGDYILHNDDLLMSVLNTDERLLKYGELVFSLEDIQSEVEGYGLMFYYSIRQEGEQVIYSRSWATEYNVNDWASYYWENGQGLVEYIRGFRAERDTLYMKNITVR